VTGERQALRKLFDVHRRSGSRANVRVAELEKPRILLLGFAAPALERPDAVDALRDPRQVERRDQFLVDQHAAPPQPRFEGLDSLSRAGIAPQETGPQAAVTMRQRLLHEYPPRGSRVDGTEVHATSRGERKTVERDGLAGGHVTALRQPLRIAIAPAHQVVCRSLDPGGLDRRDRARVDAMRLCQRRSHEPTGRPVAKGRSRRDDEP